MKLTKHEKRKAHKQFKCWITGQYIYIGDYYWRTEGFYLGRRFMVKSTDPTGSRLDSLLSKNRNHETWSRLFELTRDPNL